MKVLYTALFIFVATLSFSQEITNVKDLQPSEDYDNIHIKKLDTDSNSTSFVIWIKQGVKSHKHEHHSEVLYVIEGEGEMTIGEKTNKIKGGDYFRIPKNTYHSLKVTSKEPVKVISVQAPEFFGKDRVFEIK
ncbi:MAG: cupin domain-containing protein [Vicingaceae bacterium]|nr:cupin domain-containing protein [Vicingaceae bacterium]